MARQPHPKRNHQERCRSGWLAPLARRPATARRHPPRRATEPHPHLRLSRRSPRSRACFGRDCTRLHRKTETGRRGSGGATSTCPCRCEVRTVAVACQPCPCRQPHRGEAWRCGERRNRTNSATQQTCRGTSSPTRSGMGASSPESHAVTERFDAIRASVENAATVAWRTDATDTRLHSTTLGVVGCGAGVCTSGPPLERICGASPETFAMPHDAGIPFKPPSVGEVALMRHSLGKKERS